MKSLRELYTVGRGPSSSHTIGPTRACCLFREEHPDADRYEVALFGSLALTGRGHLTDVAVRDALAPVHTSGTRSAPTCRTRTRWSCALTKTARSPAR